MTRGTVALAEARDWIGTPYVHQASCKGGGADCLGLLRGVWRALYGAEPAPLPGYTADWSEAAGEERLLAAASRHLLGVDDLPEAPGDVLVFRMATGAVAKHLGILSSPGPQGAFVHAYCGHGVVESPLSAPWRRRIAARFRFPQEI